MPDAHPPGSAPAPDLTDEAFVDALPKVELHVHLEGSIAAPVLLALRRRHGLIDLPGTPEALAAWYDYGDFAQFIEVFLASVQALRDGEDFALLARSMAQDLAAQGVRYAEVAFTPWLHLARGLPLDEVFAGIEAGRREAERSSDITVRWIADAPGENGPEAAENTLDALLALDGGVARVGAGGSVVAFGLGGPEVPRAPFAHVFARAREAGLHAVPHAGEAAGPESMWAALDALGAERIGHGIAALADPELVRRLRDDGIVLDVCPTSNVRTRVVDGVENHPLRAMIDAGLAVTINSDDPPMFGTSVRQEYLLALGALGLSRAQLLACVRTAVGAGFMPEPTRRGLHAELDRLQGAG